ncbi:MAG: DUF1592 domain-containing protein [Bryobacteraceae bacterium]
MGLVCGLPAFQPSSETQFHETVQPLFAKYCYACHNGKIKSGALNLEAYTTAASVARDRERWETILRKIQTGEMPPKGTPRPNPADIKFVTGWIESEFERADASAKPEPGRVTARRLNRAEYNNTVRDLLGVDFHPADDFPQDDSGYGFDNIGDALSLSPVLMEKYLSAASKIARAALFGPEILKPTVVRHQPPYRLGADGGDNARFLADLGYTMTNYDVTGLTLPSALHAMHRFPVDGEYIFRVSPEGNRPRPSDPFQVAIWIDGKQAKTIGFEASNSATSMEGEDKETRIRVPAGDHWIAVSALRLFEGLPVKYGGMNPTAKPPLPLPDPAKFIPTPPDATPERIAEIEKAKASILAKAKRPPTITDVNFRVNFVEITGPFDPAKGPSPASAKKIFTCPNRTPESARKIVSELARRAYRRPVTAREVNRLLALMTDDQKRGDSFERTLAVPIEAMLVSPNFLFRIESDPKPRNNDPEHSIGDYELASRLSYFLWSSMPDDELLRCADRKTLRRPDVLAAQARRMLKDPKSQALIENFGGQWLEFRALESVKPDPERFRNFDEYLRMSMRQETEMFFANMVREDRSVLDFLDAKYSFLNEELAKFYGIAGVTGPEFRKVDLTGTPRGGVLTQASVLTASSYATRTSVVLRGKWILENLLNAPVPPPPPNVPALDEASVGASMSLRQQMEKHRANPVCSSCHSRMDPLGFGLENFDAIGHWRARDGKFPIDASGVLPDGKAFNGPDELKAILKGDRGAFADCLTEKLLTYALGRGLEHYDKPALKTISSHLAQNDYRFSTLVLEIVKSLPFQMRRGDRAIHDNHT